MDTRSVAASNAGRVLVEGIDACFVIGLGGGYGSRISSVHQHVRIWRVQEVTWGSSGAQALSNAAATAASMRAEQPDMLMGGAMSLMIC